MNIQMHHFKTTFMCPRSIVGVLFDSVSRFQTSLLLHTTCNRPAVPDVIGVLAVWRHDNNKKTSKDQGQKNNTKNQRSQECLSIWSGKARGRATLLFHTT